MQTMIPTSDKRWTPRRLKALRRKLGINRGLNGLLSVAKSAELIGVARRTWINWEQGRFPARSTGILLDMLDKGNL